MRFMHECSREKIEVKPAIRCSEGNAFALQATHSASHAVFSPLGKVRIRPETLDEFDGRNMSVCTKTPLSHIVAHRLSLLSRLTPCVLR